MIYIYISIQLLIMIFPIYLQYQSLLNILLDILEIYDMEVMDIKSNISPYYIFLLVQYIPIYNIYIQYYWLIANY